MLKPEEFCNDFAKQHRHLSSELRKRTQTALDIARVLGPDQLLAGTAERVAEQVAVYQRAVEGDRVAALKEVSIEPPEFEDIGRRTELRGDDFEDRFPCWMWAVRFRWSGPAEFGYWPDETGDDLTIFENHSQLGCPPTLKWLIGPGELNAGCFAPDSDGQSSHPTELYRRAVDHLSAYVRAFDEQVSRWHESLMERLIRHLEERQRVLRAGRAEKDSITQRFQDWRVGPLRQVLAEPEAFDEKDRPSSTPETLEHPVIHRLPHLPVASLEEVTRVVNRWTSAVEKYPAAFAVLEEERLSDLLVATLNGAFAHAEREVFIGSGKSDFYVTSNSIGEDGTTEIFVGETKIWDGQKHLIDGLGQSLNNLTRRALSALLLVAVKNRESFSDAAGEGHSAIEADERVLDKAPPIAACCSYWVRSALDPRQRVRLAVVWADLTKSQASLARPKGKQAAT